MTLETLERALILAQPECYLQNSGGAWGAENAEATYETTPDKESPLWNAHSQVIYWWTATEVDDERAYMIVYDGKVWSRAKQQTMGYLGFRCVK